MPVPKGFKHTPESISKMSAAKIGNKYCLGRVVSVASRAKMSAARIGNKNCVGHHNHWKGGRAHTGEGYIRILLPTHPRANGGYVLEHRLVMEAHLGRTLLPTEVVHHINGIVDDNRTENLQRFDSPSDHAAWHHGAEGRT